MVRILYIVAFLLILCSGCTYVLGTRKPYRGNGEWREWKVGSHSVVIMQPLISFGGQSHSLDSVSSCISQGARQVINQKYPRLSVQNLRPDEFDERQLTRVHGIYEAINTSAIDLTYRRPAHRRAELSPTFRKELADLGIRADAALFFWASDESDWRAGTARKVAGEFAGFALEDAGGERIEAPRTDGTPVRGASAALVRTADGELLWYNFVEYHAAMGLTCDNGTAEAVADVLSNW